MGIKNIKFEIISEEKACAIIDSYCNKRSTQIGKFIFIRNSGCCVAIDNSTGNCWVEDFQNLCVAIQYLIDETLDAESAIELDRNQAAMR